MPDFDVAVVGAGVAGLTAAAVAGRGGARTVLIDAMGVGGQVMTVDHIENMPGFPQGISGYELGPVLQEQAIEAGVDLVLGQVTAIVPQDSGFTLQGDEEICAKSVIVAAGSYKRKLGVPGEELLEGKGVSHCASCDAPIFKGKTVVVIGGGDAACDEALVLAQHAETVLLIHRGASLRAQPILIDRVHGTPSISLHPNSSVTEILGDNVVTGIRLADGQTITAEGVFIYIGLVPNTTFLGDLVRLSATGHVIADIGMATSRAGIFAAGDIREGSAALLAASAGDGATAARTALRYLSMQQH